MSVIDLQGIVGAVRTRERAESVLKATFGLFGYCSDLDEYGKLDHWLGYMEQFKKKGDVTDDCDGFSRLVIDMLFWRGGFRLDELAECTVKAAPTRTPGIINHHVGAVLIEREWLYFHCWCDRLLTLKELTDGGYTMVDSNPAAPIGIYSHRLCSASRDADNMGWEMGEV